MQGDFTRWTFDARRAYRSVLLQQGRVLLDADFNEQAEITSHHDEARTRDTVGPCGGPVHGAGFAVVDPKGERPDGTLWNDLRITPGTYYVDGVLAEAAFPPGDVGWPLADQPYLGRIGDEPGLPEPPGDGPYAAWLDVWTHHVTADEDPSLRESALGGPDTTTRARTVWQVRVERVPLDTVCSDLHGREPEPRPTMTAGLTEPPPDPDPCRITAAGGYQLLENQLYRVQIHDASGNRPTYLWSRENASVIAGLTGIEPSTTPGMDADLLLDRVGRDAELSIAVGDTVEITSTDFELRGRPGVLATAGAPDGLRLPVTLAGNTPGSFADLGRVPLVRRWEGPAREVGAGPDDLEGGIQVGFGGSGYRTGDYWLVPARAVRLAYGLTAEPGTIEWPVDGTGAPLPRPPAGPTHHVTPLAILERRPANTDARWFVRSDCRRRYPLLTEQVSLHLLGGDGQEAPPGEPLPRPVRFAVRNGGLPVPGAAVLLAASAGGHLAVGSAPTSASPSVLRAQTDELGVVDVRWLLERSGPATQVLAAERLDDRGEPIAPAAGVTGRLRTPSARTPGVHIEHVNVAGRLFENDSDVKVDELVKGVTVGLDDAVLVDTVRGTPVMRVVVDLPWPLTKSERAEWLTDEPVGFRPIEVAGACTVDGAILLWQPTAPAARWLTGPLRELLGPAGRREPLVTRLFVDGWAILSRTEPPRQLNTHAMVELRDGRTVHRLPTDDEITGGVFVQWFGLRV